MSSQRAFYLKYRPQTLDQLIGQDEVKKTLLSAYQNNKLSHAYLLVGPRGTGKTSTARILAKMVNCEGKDTPCNKCSICLSITDGSNLDLIEIDAASNRGIEDIRALRERVKLAPTEAGKKVYIIDEIHMLTQEAFNALLKTLEEPPAHVLFILATTDVGKLPQTILSRVQRLDFKQATPIELKQALQKVVDGEKIDIDEAALSLLVKLSNGSFRDGVKLLDQVSALGKITADDITHSLHGVMFEEVYELLENLADHKSKESILLITKQVEKGADIKVLTRVMMELARSLMLIKNNLGTQLVQSNYGDEEYKRLAELAGRFTILNLIKSLEILQEASEKLKFTSILELPLELAVVEICSSEYSENSVSQKVSESESQIKSETSEPENQKKEKSDILIHRSTDTPFSPDLSDTPNSDIQKLKEKWTFVLETIRPYNFSLEALLRSINILECTNATVVVEVPYSFHQRILEAPKNRDLLEGILSDILGRQVRVSTVLGSKPSRVEDIANVEVAADDEIIRVAAEIFSSDPLN